MGSIDRVIKQVGTSVRQAVSMDAPSYPSEAPSKVEEKEQMTEPADEFRDLESNKAKTTSPEPDTGPRT
jgi:hypothetical protein